MLSCVCVRLQVHAEAGGRREKLYVTCWKTHVHQDQLITVDVSVATVCCLCARGSFYSSRFSRVWSRLKVSV